MKLHQTILAIFLAFSTYFISCNHGDSNDANPSSQYPLLAMWWPDTWNQSAEDLARYDWIGLGEGENEELVSTLKALNPGQQHFTSISLTELNWVNWDKQDEWNYIPILENIPSQWFLTQVGSTLSEAIDANQTIIPVTATRLDENLLYFKPGDTVTCGFESMLVTEVDDGNRTITVERGYVRRAEDHPLGERIAAHITFWPETWVMNVSSECPLYDAGHGEESWTDWAIRVYLKKQWKEERDGYIVDRVEESESWLIGEYARSIDPYANNELASDEYQRFNEGWYDGIHNFLLNLRHQLNGKPIFANSFGAYSDVLNGSIFESCPGNWSETIFEDYQSSWNERILDAETGYIGVTGKGYSPNYSFLETYQLEEYHDSTYLTDYLSDSNFVLDYQRMRYGLTSALLGNGYFSYELNTNGHGSLGLFWFDEYDNTGAGRGYLGNPLGSYEILEDFGDEGMVFQRRFDHGLVLCNPSDREATVVLDKSYRLIHGNQCPLINTGELVRTIQLDAKDGRILLNP